MELENIKSGCRLNGISADGAVQIVAVRRYGNDAVEITYKANNGSLGNLMIYREDQELYSLAEKSAPWSFTADGNAVKLASEAYRIHLAHLFDPYLAVHTSSIEPLPHQISAVYQEMLPRLPLRYILADDPGAGKTVMTGLLMKELIIRGDLKRCLIVAPGSLCEQWQDELRSKYHIRFDILTSDRIEASVSGNVFAETDLCIARLDKLARSDELQQKLRATEWDLIVVDEAHKLSATVWGNEIKYTRRYQLGRLLSGIARHFLLLTATPHNGKSEDFQLFLALIDPDRFEGVQRTGCQNINVSDVMRRLVKEELLRFDGTPLFPERRAYTVNYSLSPKEARLYKEVTNYVQDEFNRADKLRNDRKSTVGFALTILQRRLASSPEAIYQSLRRRRERLENRLAEEKLGRCADEYHADISLYSDEDDYSPEELEEVEEQITDQASAAATIAELEAEIHTLKRLESIANEVRLSGSDRKWEELSKLLQDNGCMFGADGQREKLIIFTEHRDTLRYLCDKIRSLLGNDEAVVTIHGGMLREERRKTEQLFRQDKDVVVLIATDAAGEGINLQRAHLMVNFDLPWNPNRLEQRFGRIHRIGQTEVCHLWNLVSDETREGMVFQRLFQKLEEERAALGGKVFDILGKLSFSNRSLRDLLLEAIRYGNDPEVQARLRMTVDSSLDKEKLRRLIEENALTDDTMDVSKVMEIKAEMERAEAHKLQPHFIGAFFVEAFRIVGGSIHKRENGRYEITSVPFSVRNRNIQDGSGETVLTKYERICFDKSKCSIPGCVHAELICPGHPLLEAVSSLIRERYSELMKQGTVYVDDEDQGLEPRILFCAEDSIQDGSLLKSGKHRVISQALHFVELKKDGSAKNAGYAPYLDYRPLKGHEAHAVSDFISRQDWLVGSAEEMAQEYAISNIIPRHFTAVKERRMALLDKTARAVKERLTAEIQYWDFRSAELKQKESAGKSSSRLNSENAARRAEELAARMHRRLDEIAQERRISAMPPIITGGSLIIPGGLMRALLGDAAPAEFSADGRKAVEQAAMKAVFDIETLMGFIPHDVSAQNVGYDIESEIPEDKRAGTCLRFIEVKGRAKGADSVTVTKNEILTALNRPDEYILALVETDGVKTRALYLKKPFRSAPDFTAVSVNYSISELVRNAEIIYQE